MKAHIEGTPIKKRQKLKPSQQKKLLERFKERFPDLNPDNYLDVMKGGVKYE